jgi:hypothetical protein
MHDVFGISELLELILLKVDEPSSLLHCALPSRLWAEIALPLLWCHPIHRDCWTDGDDITRLAELVGMELEVSVISGACS